ncbi:type II toxin-antitoxin system HipA family toxin [Paenarthrobacter sp. JL.01a]|uniref:type II toxin-antitoxin system HipA family toxin n=1 Tax=Paenarthrobacter sp. JL.01a TaxID=2979324 RepID=UPI0021C77B71|nr:type II toxin-antitoxin system HipA family toxin [Paenarthrobacter sp. JL.01a]UXM92409.1 type II toxin-antitoxin system HipA family toxin [Paenarthrobacter sp. JL.01a]
MAVRNIRQIEVLVNEALAGTMDVATDGHSSREHISFTYADSWLSAAEAFEVSPELPLRRGPQTPTLGRDLFGSFQDAAPDDWGKKLLFQELRQKALADGARRIPPTGEAGYLLLVNDETRQGALRFRENGQFLSSWGREARVRDLKVLADEARLFSETGEVKEENSLLMGAGSSPGGAQPKAWIRDHDGSMLLAKFPKTSDINNVQMWEMVAVRLQQRARILVAESRLMPLTEFSHIFLTRRFDRDGSRRIPYMSVRTALQLDTYSHPDYVKIASEVAHLSASPVQDANELFSRAAFIAMVNNTDDHMRNHGLLRTGTGWRLSPSFDVNPMPVGTSETPLTPHGGLFDRDVRDLLDFADAFRLTRDSAIERLQHVAEAVSHWREEALSLGADAETLDYMVRAFEGENSRRVASLTPAPAVIDIGASSESKPRQSHGHVWVPEHVRSGKIIPGHFRRRS